jgi:hypothetical protein
MIERTLSRVYDVLDFPKRKVEPYLYKFRARQAARILQHPQRERTREIHTKDPAMQTNFPIPAQEYHGTWYKQVGPSCGAWALVNAFHAQNHDVATDIDLKKLAQVTHAYASVWNHGLNGESYSEFAKLLNLPVKATKTGFISKMYPEHFLDEKGNLTQSGMDVEATWIKSFLRKKKGIVVAVDAGKFYKIPFEHASHAIAVVGNTENFSHVICIDSNRGITKVPFHHFYKSLAENSFYVLEKQSS